MPTPRDHLGAVAVGGRIYAVGGRNRQAFTLGTLEVYDPAVDRWAVLPPMLTGRSGHAVAALGGCVYVLGGEGNPAAPSGNFARVEAYVVAEARWVRLGVMPTPRHGLGAVVLGGRIYLPAGAVRQGLGASAVLEAYTPPPCPAR